MVINTKPRLTARPWSFPLIGVDRRGLQHPPHGLQSVQSDAFWDISVSMSRAAMIDLRSTRTTLLLSNNYLHLHPSLISRDGNFTCGCRYPTRRVWAWVPFFTYGLDPHPLRESAGAGVGFILDFHGFSPASPPKFLSASKVWPNPTISPTQVPYRNPRLWVADPALLP
jgi:hypothetical protein